MNESNHPTRKITDQLTVLTQYSGMDAMLESGDDESVLWFAVADVFAVLAGFKNAQDQALSTPDICDGPVEEVLHIWTDDDLFLGAQK